MATYSSIKYDFTPPAATTSTQVGTGAMVLIKSIDSDGSDATISFVNGASDVVLDNTYKTYIFKFINIHPETNNADLGFKGSSATGSNYGIAKTTTFFSGRHSEADANADLTYIGAFDLAQSTSAQRVTGSIDSDNDASASGYMCLYSPSSTTFVKHFISQTNRMYDYESGTPPQWAINSFVAGYFNTTSAVDAIQFSMDTGEIQGGTIKMYGIA